MLTTGLIFLCRITEGLIGASSMSGLTLNVSYIYVCYGTPSALLPPCPSRAYRGTPSATYPLQSSKETPFHGLKRVSEISHNKCILYCKSHISLRFPPRGEAAGKQSLSNTLRGSPCEVITCKLSLKSASAR